MVQLTIPHHWFRKWLGAKQLMSHYLNQCPPDLSLTQICGTRGRWVESERTAQLYGVAALAPVLIVFSIQPGLQSGWHIQPWEERGRSLCTGWRHHWPSWHSCLSSIYHQNYREGWGMPSRLAVSTITRKWESKWMGEWMDEWMSEWTISWMNECLNAGVSVCVCVSVSVSEKEIQRQLVRMGVVG